MSESQQQPIDINKLIYQDKESIELFLNQIKLNGWCCLKLSNSIHTAIYPPVPDPLTAIHHFFSQSEQYKDQFVMQSNNLTGLGYIKSDSVEQYNILTGHKYFNESTKFSSTYFSRFKCTQEIIQYITVELLHIICDKQFKEITSTNELSVVRDIYYKQKYINMISSICSVWIKYKQMIPIDINKLICKYYKQVRTDIKDYNYGMLHFNQYTTKKYKRLLVKSGFFNGFITLFLGSNLNGLKLYDNKTKKYIDCNYRNAVVFIGKQCSKMMKDSIPFGQYQIKYSDASEYDCMNTSLFEICTGNTIPYLSCDNTSFGKHKSELLLNEKRLNDLNVGPDTLRVRSRTGHRYSISYDSTKLFSMHMLKLILQPKVDIPMNAITIIYKGRLLYSHQTVQQLGIQSGDVLHMAIICFSSG
eukprot:310952_1